MPKFKVSDIIRTNNGNTIKRAQIILIDNSEENKRYKLKVLDIPNTWNSATGMLRVDHIDENYDLCPIYLLDKQFNKDLENLLTE